MAIVLDIAGIKGESTFTDAKLSNKVVASSFDYDIHKSISMEIGNMKNRSRSAGMQLSYASITRQSDTSSIALIDKSFKTDIIEKVIIHIVQESGADGKATAEPFLQIELSDVIISAFSISASHDGIPQETLTLAYTKIQYSYKGKDPKNVVDQTKRVGYDLAKSQTI